MAVGDFTKEEAKVVHECIEEMFEAIPKRRQMEYIGHLNEVLVFVERASKHALHERDEAEARVLAEAEADAALTLLDEYAARIEELENERSNP